MLWYSLEARGASNEYPQHMFLWRNKKKYQYLSVDEAAYLDMFIIHFFISRATYDLNVPQDSEGADQSVQMDL